MFAGKQRPARRVEWTRAHVAGCPSLCPTAHACRRTPDHRPRGASVGASSDGAKDVTDHDVVQAVTCRGRRPQEKMRVANSGVDGGTVTTDIQGVGGVRREGPPLTSVTTILGCPFVSRSRNSFCRNGWAFEAGEVLAYPTARPGWRPAGGARASQVEHGGRVYASRRARKRASASERTDLR